MIPLLARLDLGVSPSRRLVADAVHASVQSAGEAAASEVVRAAVRQGEEEDHQGVGADGPRSKAQNVQLSGVERPEGCVQEVGGWAFAFVPSPLLLTTALT